MRDEDFIDDINEEFADVSTTDSESEPVFAFNRDVKFDYVSDVKKRMANLEHNDIEGMTEECARWIHRLPVINIDEIEQNIKIMNIDIPEECYDMNEILKLYSHLISHIQILGDYIADVNRYCTILNIAASEIKSVARGLATYKLVPDKEALACKTVLIFTLQYGLMKDMLDRLNGKMKYLDSKKYALTSILDHHKYLARINQKYLQDGISATYESGGQNRTNSEYEPHVRKLYNGS